MSPKFTNNAHPTTLTCIKPPGNFCIQGDKPLNKFSESLVLNKISPIQTKSGNAVKVHEEDVPHIVVAIASPTGLDVNNIIPIATLRSYSTPPKYLNLKK